MKLCFSVLETIEMIYKYFTEVEEKNINVTCIYGKVVTKDKYKPKALTISYDVKEIIDEDPHAFPIPIHLTNELWENIINYSLEDEEITLIDLNFFMEGITVTGTLREKSIRTRTKD